MIFTRLFTFVTQLRNRFNKQKVTVLSYLPREETRHIALDEYQRRTAGANRFFRDDCAQHFLVLELKRFYRQLHVESNTE